MSGSLDGKLRLWHIPDKKVNDRPRGADVAQVALWNEVDGARLITALTIVRNGKFVCVGTFDGRCVIYTTEQLKYHTVIDVRSTRGKNKRGHKITGLAVHQDKVRAFIRPGLGLRYSHEVVFFDGGALGGPLL